MANAPVVTPIPSATVILVREAGGHLETLLLRRNSKIAFHGGAWVFPGGRIDPEDHTPESPEDMLAAARRAAVRESQEEAGLTVPHEEMIWVSHWTTPEGQPQRYSTWFFLAAARDEAVQIDGDEIHDHRWMRPDLALAAQREKEIELPPPTFVTLTKLSTYRSVTETLSHLSAREPEIFVPRYTKVTGGICSMYEDDVGYPDVNVDRPGQRHRLWMIESGWKYEKTS
ncbi:MAG: NUDIX hydrolase [Deltaproteobacteria bacterium]|nr:NUDIX hydrolase [Deltaproteobacteria bacterium]